jgi:hypothetical protein
MFRPAARFLIAPRPPVLFAARFLAAVILPPLLFFAILNLLFDLFSPYPNALVPRVVAGRAGKFSLTPAGSRIPAASHIHLHSAEQVQNQQDDQNQPDNPYASARPPSPISVVASTAAKQKQQDNNQQDQSHGNLLSVAHWLRRWPALWSFQPTFSQAFLNNCSFLYRALKPRPGRGGRLFSPGLQPLRACACRCLLTRSPLAHASLIIGAPYRSRSLLIKSFSG